MLKIVIPGAELFNDDTNEFIQTQDRVIMLEHSLVSISKWEAKWKKPFIGSDKTDEEVLDYVKHMTITQNVPSHVYTSLSQENIKEINDYIDDDMTATTFLEDGDSRVTYGKKQKDVITSEVIYYQLMSHNIDIKCEKWHIKRLLTLIRVFNEMNSDKKPLTEAQILARNKKLNDERKAKMKTKG